MLPRALREREKKSFQPEKADFKKVLVKALDAFDVEDVDFESGGVEKILIDLYGK